MHILEINLYMDRLCFLTFLSRQSKAILIHQLSKKVTQRIPFKLHGLPVSTAFHPTRSVFFISTKKNVRVYDLLKLKLIKKLESGAREVSSISVHPGGMLPVSMRSFAIPCLYINEKEKQNDTSRWLMLIFFFLDFFLFPLCRR